MKRNVLLAIAVGAATAAAAYDIVWLHMESGLSKGLAPDRIDNIANDGSGNLTMALADGSTYSHALADGSSVKVGESDGIISVAFDGNKAVVMNPAAFDGVDISVDGADITVTSDVDFEMSVTGTTASGRIKTYGTGAPTVTLDNASLASAVGSVLNFQSTADANVCVKGNCVLADAATYETPEGEKENGTLNAVANLTVSGSGVLTISGVYKHAVNVEECLTLEGGVKVNVTSSANDGIHSKGCVIDGASYSSAATVGDAVDAGKGKLELTGATIDITVPTADTKGLKSDKDIVINGSDITMTLTGDQVKGIKSKGNTAITNSTVKGTATGNAVVVDNDPSYCTFIKSDGSFTLDGGTINLIHNGRGGKGISTDGDCILGVSGANQPSVEITCTGDGEAYVDVDNLADYYNSTCITADGNIAVNYGTYVLKNSGVAGKCIKSDGEMTFGVAGDDNSLLNINAQTTGARYLVSSGSSSGWGGGWGPGMDNADYSNPKVVKAVGNFTIYSGNIVASGAKDGGEALESKATLTISGGNIECSTYDDCINAANHIQIDGGVIYCLASGNDAVDSNGTIAMTGGVMVCCSSAGSPETGLDNDGRTFALTGGILVAAGSGNDKPTGSQSTQCSFSWGKSVSKGTVVTVTDASGNHLLSFTVPCSNISSMLMTHPAMTTGTHTIYTGGTVSGGTAYPQLVVNGQYTPGTSQTTVKPSTSCTSVGTSSGGGVRP